ncbi:MAG: Spy/CpxP family protein refolding chaperone [Caulobacter sp.]|nr:Spy/CpxP family protein refolding chaperone [Vitreoscilla sp.]
MMMGGREGQPSTGPGMAMMRRHGGYGSPMNVIINVGPGIQVDVEDEDGRRAMGRGGMMRERTPGMMGDGMPMRNMPGGQSATMGPGAAVADRLHEVLAERVEGGLAFLRAELQVQSDQEAAWNAFSARIREAATRFRAARERISITAPADGLDGRLAAHEVRLTAELERVRACIQATAALLPALNDAQRRTVEALSWLIVPGGGPGPMAAGMSAPSR